MQLKQFLSDNITLGKGAVKIPAGEMIEKYRKQYDAMKTRNLKFKHEVHALMPGARAIVHVKVPSETVDNFFYDVVIEFDPFINGNVAGKRAHSFEDCHVKVFSNCPSFVYTYAYVFYHMKDPERGSDSMIIDKFNQKIPKDRLMIKGLEKSLGEKPLTDDPVVRNPYGLPLFDKSIYYAIFYIIETLNVDRTVYNKRMITEKQFLQGIPDFDYLMTLRKSQEQKMRERKRKETRAKTKQFEDHERDLARVNRLSSSGNGMKKPSRSNSVKSMQSARTTSRKSGVNKIG